MNPMMPRRFSLGLSGALPEPEEMTQHQASDFDIKQVVEQIARVVFQRGGRIVYGSHPTFTPIVRGVAEQWQPPASSAAIPDEQKAVRMFVGRRYFDSQQDWDDYLARHQHYASVVAVGTTSTDRETALEALRKGFIGEADALVCIGGKLHRDDGQKPGVEEEFQIARGLGKPVYLLGGFGGKTFEIFQDLARSHTDLSNELRNGLSDAENRELGESNRVWHVVKIIARGIDQFPGDQPS